ncbi:response regulator transcription factor [Thiomicrorhabdus heinhorstiae]|uniref:Response regulator transcription factor n=1 Tax=Thiomicrorhabdus heinhorstiae TaxID=2748010 RepID=A0ABS0C0Z0_9GAMM|nr:response regulator transcription factor [Thiomicrorhabdus heinhorstiae]MBF6058746.1 response regulator transcription factor [Thiomicrorhabdus heinhorstiae]
MKLLLVEDEPLLVETLARRLSEAKFLLDTATDGEEALYLLNEFSYDLVILDLGLPKLPGLEVLQTLRADQTNNNRSIPVLILTARNAWQERVEGLKAGADDYVGKPFQFEELLARVEVLLRRKEGVSEKLAIDDMVLDLASKQLTVGEQAYNLTMTEFRLMRVFLAQPNRVFSKDELIQRIADQNYDRESNVIEVYIRKLRKMLGKERIETLRGLGYKLVVGGAKDD